MLLELTSLQNPKIKAALKLNERRERNRSGLFAIEGYRELSRAVAGKVQLQTLFYCPQLFLGSNEPALIEQIGRQGTELIACHPNVFEKLSYRDRPDGLLGIGVQMKQTLQDLDRALTGVAHPFIIVAEAIEKPGNLGTILRSADAAGVDGVIVCDRCTDIYNPNVVRASVGTLFTLPVIEASSEETLNFLRAKQIRIAAATPSAKEMFTDAQLSESIAIAVGTEQLGLTKTWMDAADLQVRIPMHGVADSLNVATATTLLLYEVVRQRQVRA
jgi:TrmH family RNA methyltransferase